MGRVTNRVWVWLTGVTGLTNWNVAPVNRVVKSNRSIYVCCMSKPQKPKKPYVRPTHLVGVRLPKEDLEWLEARAKADDRSVPYVIKRLIADARAQEEGKARKAA
jgi:hypothetical protein